MVWVDRTYFTIRRRYRSAGFVGSAVAVALAAFYLVPHVHGAERPPITLASWDILGGAILLLMAVVVPPLVAGLCWRLHRRRYLDEA